MVLMGSPSFSSRQNLDGDLIFHRYDTAVFDETRGHLVRTGCDRFVELEVLAAGEITHDHPQLSGLEGELAARVRAVAVGTQHTHVTRDLEIPLAAGRKLARESIAGVVE